MSQQQDQIYKSHNDPDGSSTHWTTPDLIEKHWKHGSYLRRDTRLGDCVYMKAKGWFLIHRVKCARWLRPITFDDLCMRVWVLVCGQWYLGVFSFFSTRSDCWCCDFCVKWLSSVQSDIHSNVFPLFPLQGSLRYLRYKWKGWLFHTLVDLGRSGREEPELRPSINLFFCLFFSFYKKR